MRIGRKSGYPRAFQAFALDRARPLHVAAVAEWLACADACLPAADSVATLSYRLRPSVRGNFSFQGTQLRLHSPLWLWRQSRVVGTPQSVRVFPNFAPLAGFALFSAEQASRLVGAHIKRRRGEGTDFHQMREYRVGDSMRQIDWKATARARKLISREYQDERNQQVMLLLDTGRRLLARDGAADTLDAEPAHSAAQRNRRRLTRLKARSDTRPITPMVMMPKMIWSVASSAWLSVIMWPMPLDAPISSATIT